MADIVLLIKISEKVYNALTHTEFDANLVLDEMRKSIANGTPLVHCNECKWYLKDADNTGYCKVCEGFAIDIPQHDEGYCSYGERKE